MSDGSIKWINGLRGVASFLVILTHLARAWDMALFNVKDNELSTGPRILQLPVLRIPWQGRIGVTLFAFITGFVCGIKPLGMARNGQAAGALKVIHKSAFRRPPRLMLPATIITFITWLITQLGAMKVAHHCDSPWLRNDSPFASKSARLAVWDLLQAYRSVWSNGFIQYDRHQWTLLPLLEGAMNVYIALCATIYMKFRYRVLTYSIMMLYYHQSSFYTAETFGQQFFFGLILCDVSQHPPVQQFIAKNRRLTQATSIVLLSMGLFFASYPQGGHDWAGWSHSLQVMGSYVFPPKSEIPRRFSALATEFIAVAIWLNDPIKHVLAMKPLLWLGKQSFAVYLIHGTLLRTILVWMVYGIFTPWQETINEKGEKVTPPWLKKGGPMTFTIAIPIWIGIVYFFANLWTNHIDAWCARVTKKLETIMFEEEGALPVVTK